MKMIKTLKLVILAGIGVGVIGACTSRPAAVVSDSVAPAEVTASEPLKLADAVVANAEQKPADQKPAEKPPLPAGHPPVGGSDAKADGLPSGHPPVGGADANAGGLPAGHPPTGGGATGLPSGHPEVPANPTTGNVPAGAVRNASIGIKAVQGTKGGPAVGADPLVVEYYDAQGKVVGKTESKLDAKGEVTIKEISFPSAVQPLITVTHQGVEYRAVGSVLSSRAGEQQVEMTVYEATDKEPAWVIKMRHVMLANSPAGVHVTEMVSLHNPTDQAWIGTKSQGGKPVTLRLPLPAGASDVQFTGGFHECCTKVVDGAIEYAMPMTPGDTQFQFTYRVPADSSGAAKITLAAPAATQHLMVFIPDDGTTFTSDSFKKIEPKKNQNLRAKSRFYGTDPYEKGKTLTFTVGGLAEVKAAATPAPWQDPETETAAGTAGNPAAKVPGIAKIVGGVGAGAILVIGTAVVLFKGRNRIETSNNKAVA